MINRRDLTLTGAAAALVAATGARAQGATPVEGKDFVRLPTPAPVAAPAGKIEVVEFFSYGCPHCGETSIEEAPALKPGLYADLTEDQARQMACDTRRMLEAWMAQGAPDKSATTATVSGALAEQAAQIAEPVTEMPAPPTEDIEPMRPSRRADERKQRPIHYDC